MSIAIVNVSPERLKPWPFVYCSGFADTSNVVLDKLSGEANGFTGDGLIEFN